MSLPDKTIVLIVGAGPTGLSAALSLAKNGCKDFVIVDALPPGDNYSRAMGIHARTLEVLELIGVTDLFIENGATNTAMTIYNGAGKSKFVSLDFAYLKPYTKYPFVLALPQCMTEQILTRELEKLGVNVLRPHRAVGIKSCSNESGLEVSFENGEVIKAKYVLGADGPRSVIRSMCGIGFSDPDGVSVEKSLESESVTAQMILGDVTFSPATHPFIAHAGPQINVLPTGMFLALPMPDTFRKAHNLPPGDRVYRIGMNFPLDQGPPPSHPDAEFLREYLKEHGPQMFRPDPKSKDQEPELKISNVIWSSRFRTHAAIADRSFYAFPGSGEGVEGGYVMLVGDAAHIHSPAGGQGMNLGIQDAVGLGRVLAAHVSALQETPADSKKQEETLKDLEVYMTKRHQRANQVIQLTKSILRVLNTLMSTKGVNVAFKAMFALLAKVPMVRNFAVWRLSGLGND